MALLSAPKREPKPKIIAAKPEPAAAATSDAPATKPPRAASPPILKEGPPQPQPTQRRVSRSVVLSKLPVEVQLNDILNRLLFAVDAVRAAKAAMAESKALLWTQTIAEGTTNGS